MTSTLTFRPARDSDAPGLIHLIAKCFAEYENCVIDPRFWDADLFAIASEFAAKGGEIWVGETADGQLLASGGYAPTEAGAELKRVYVDGSLRGQGIARLLVSRAEEAARSRGFAAMELWTDTRFTTAHVAYQRLGYVMSGATRQLGDPSETTEFHMIKALQAIAA
jgi:putative acetyltransferase